METGKLLKSFLLVIGLASLLLLLARQAQASAVNYCASPSGTNCAAVSYTQHVKRQRNQLYAGYLNSRDQMSRPGAGITSNSADSGRILGTAALSWAIIFGGLLVLASLLRAWLIGGRRKHTGRRSLRRALATPALASTFGFLLVLVAALGTTLTSPGQSVLASAALQSNPTGNFTAVQEIGGSGITQIGGIVYDTAGNYYVTGGFTGSLSFATSPATTLSSTQDYDLFVAKYNADNQCLWARQANGASGVPAGLSLDGAATIAIDQAGNCYVGGGFVKTLAFKAANGSTVATLNAAGSNLNFELFVAKYDSSGTLQWARGGQSGSPQHTADLKAGFNSIVKIVVDGAGNPYVAGSFSGTNFLGQAISVQGLADALLAKLNPANGNPVWVSLPGGSATDSATALAIDANSNLYLAGGVKGIATFPTQPSPTVVGDANTFQDGFVAKYTSAGACLWVSPIKGGPLVLVHDLVANAAGETFLTGAFIGQAQFSGDWTVFGTDLHAGYVAHLYADGIAGWAQVFGGENISGPAFASGRRILLDGAGNFYVAGNFQSGAHFGGEEVTATDLTTPNGFDQFIAKFSGDERFQWVKAILGTGEESPNLITGENVTAATNPMQLFYDPTAGKIRLAGDTNGTVDFDGIPVDSNGQNSAPADNSFRIASSTQSAASETRHAFIATFTPPPPPPPPCEDHCPKTVEPVCDIVTGARYDNACLADCAGVEVGPCAPSNALPIARCRDITVSAGADCKADASIDNGSSDPDGDQIMLAQSPAGPYSLGSTTVSLTVTDSKGASAQCQATVTVVDNTRPQITCPANIDTTTAPNQCSATVNIGAATATDNCGVQSITGARSDNQPLDAPYPKGTTTITWKAADAAGNFSTCTQTVSVADNQAPAIACPPNIIRTAARPGAATAAVIYASPTASDNCGGTDVSCSPPSGSALPTGTTTVTCKATDTSGNQSSCSFTVTVFDACIQDDSSPSKSVVFNTSTGDFIFCCGATKVTGRGRVSVQGNTYTLTGSSSSGPVQAKVDMSVRRGTASLNGSSCTVTDRDVTDNACPCVTQ